jgi:hypothetical protein
MLSRLQPEAHTHQAISIITMPARCAQGIGIPASMHHSAVEATDMVKNSIKGAVKRIIIAFISLRL